MDVIIDFTVKDKNGRILHETKNKLLQTESTPISAQYTKEELNLKIAMMLPRQEEIEWD